MEFLANAEDLEIKGLADSIANDGSQQWIKKTCETREKETPQSVPKYPSTPRAVHVIASPFPSVWHTMEDDREHLDWPNIHWTNAVLRVFLAELLHVEL